MLPFGKVIWRHIWKCTLEKSQIIAANVNLHPHMNAIWGNLWEHTAEKSQTNATNVTLHHPMYTFENAQWSQTINSQTIAANVTLLALTNPSIRHNHCRSNEPKILLCIPLIKISECWYFWAANWRLPKSSCVPPPPNHPQMPESHEQSSG